jgi:hypothetical protein
VAEGTKPTTMRKLLEENDRLTRRNGALRVKLDLYEQYLEHYGHLNEANKEYEEYVASLGASDG